MTSILWALLSYVQAPSTLFLFAFANIYSWSTLRKSSFGNKWQKRFAFVSIFSCLVSFLVQLGFLSSSKLPETVAHYQLINLLGNVLTYGCITTSLLVGEKHPIWFPYIAAATVSGIFDFVFLFGPTRNFRFFSIARVAVLAILVLNITVYTILGRQNKESDLERTPLLADGSAASSTIVGSEEDDAAYEEEDIYSADKEIKKQQQQRLEQEGGWIGYLKGFLIFVPHIWPSNDRLGKFCIFVIAVILAIERGLQILTPRQLGIITNKLNERQSFSQIWVDVLLWFIYDFLNAWFGLRLLRQVASTYLENYAYKAISDISYTHVMDLSMDFHYEKDSGEVIKSVSQGSALNNLLDVASDTLPSLIDIVVAIFYVSFFLFDAKMAFIMLCIIIVYLWAGIHLTNWTREPRKDWSQKSRDESKTLYETVSNWTTIAYFNRASYERGRYLEAISKVIKSQWAYLRRSYVASAFLEFTMSFGYAATILLAIWEISRGNRPVGNLVTLIMYWSSISGPLYNLNWTVRRVVANLTDAERILQLLKTKPTVANAANAIPLDITKGEVEFEKVFFGYEKDRDVLKDFSFTAKSGQTIAFVGETGGGKSTTLKLLFRFYDVTKGAIRIDGHNIKSVTLSSLREQLGVVPQDPSMFNQTIMENIRYARLDATDEEIITACKAAAVYDKILTFPKGLQSKVGERGVKLSGGELQRIAIARVLIKNPKIVLLDEATSAVDSGTEQQIQEAFKKLSAGRTTFVIAHRLSTICEADLILVIHQGEIIERGTHGDLLQRRGRYHELWTKQTTPMISKAPSEVDKSEDLLVDDLPSDSKPSQDLHELVEESSSSPLERESGNTPTITLNPPPKTDKKND